MAVGVSTVVAVGTGVEVAVTVGVGVGVAPVTQAGKNVLDTILAV